MVYPIRVCARRGPLGSSGNTYIRLYDEDLTYISEWQFSTSGRYVSNFAIDDDGNIYLDRDGLDYLLKYDDAGGWQASANLTYPLNGISMDKNGYINALVVKNPDESRIYKRLLADLTEVSYCNLTYAYQYGALVFDQDDGDIFWVGNSSSAKVEKWSWTTGKIAEKSLTTSTYSLALVGDVLAGSLTSKLWRVAKDLSGAVVDYEIESDEVTGVISGVSDAWISGIEDNYFLVTFCAASSDPVKAYTWYLRKYSTSFVKIGVTIQLLADINNFYTPGAKGPYDMLIPPIVTNVKAEKLAGHLTLYGEIVDKKSSTIVERGFEYLVQDEEPGEEDTGTEVKETGEFEEGEYSLSSWDTYEDLYRAEENKIWWFRAYLKDDIDNKFTANLWMKNVPTMTTFECTEVEEQQAKGNGELIDLGANIVTTRGFRIIKEYSGDLFGAINYRFDGFEGDLEIKEVYSEIGTLIGFKWEGELYRDSISEDGGGYALEIYEKILGGGFTGEGLGIYLNPNDNLKVVAIAANQLGMGFGEEVELNTGQLIIPNEEGEEDETVSEISAEKTVKIGTLPDGATVTRIGIRLGRTMGCNEIHVYEDGEWGSDESLTFYITGFVPGDSYYKIPYIVVNFGDYEEEILAIPDYRNPERLEEWLEDYPIEVFPELEDEDDLDQTVVDASVGDISYRTIIKEIKCARIGDQSFIDKYGRRRSQTIKNHLIQTRSNCKTIVNDYIERFQILKLKVAIEYDIPIPFEREDVILLGDGKEKYKEDGQGLIAFKADGEGEILQEDFILSKIRKIDGRYESGKETILSLELEV